MIYISNAQGFFIPKNVSYNAQHKHFRTKTTSTSISYSKSDYIIIYFIKINHIERIIILYQNIFEGLIVYN